MDTRFLHNFVIAVPLTTGLLTCYSFMLVMPDFAFGTLNGLLDLFLPYIYLFAILYLHVSMIIGAIREKKSPHTHQNSPPPSRTRKPRSAEDIFQEKAKWRQTNRRITMAVMQLIIIDILVLIFWWIPSWPRWIAIFLTVEGVSYFLSSRFGEKRGLYSGLGHFIVVFLGWLFGRWMGIIFFSTPIILVYYLLLYQYAMVIIPANDPEAKLKPFDKDNEKWQRFLSFVWYVWGIQYPMYVVADDWGYEFPMRIKGSQFRQWGSPGIIFTRTHQAIGITAGTEFSRVEGPGVTFIKRFERPSEIVDLRRQIRISEINAITKDGIHFNARVLIHFKVNDSPSDPSYTGDFPYSKKWIRRLLKLHGTASISAGNKTDVRWDDSVVKQFEQAAQQVLSKRTLNELWQPKDTNKYNNTYIEIGDEIKTVIQKRLEEQGITVLVSRMSGFGFPEEREGSIINQQLSTWRSTWERRAHQMLAEGEIEAEHLQEEARAYAKSVLLKSLAEGIKQTRPEISQYVITSRFISAIEELMKKQPELAENLGDEATSRIESIKQKISRP